MKAGIIALFTLITLATFAQGDTTRNNPNPQAYTFATLSQAIRIKGVNKGAKVTISDKTDPRGGPGEVVDTTEGFKVDGGVIVGIPGTKYAWARDISQSIGIKPEWWGAKGDGITNDSVAMQQAYNFLAKKGGGTLLLTQSYNSPLHIGDANITVTGNGTIKNNCIYIAGAAPGTNLNCNINYIKIVYDSLYVGESLYGRDGIQLKNARNVNIDHVSFQKVNHGLFIPGLDVIQHTNRVQFTNNTVNVANYMLYVDSGASAKDYEIGDFLIDNNYAYGGIKYEHIRAYGVDGALIQNNHFFFGLDDTKKANVDMYYTNYVKLLNNQYFEAGEEAIKVGRFNNLTIIGGSIAWPGQNAVSAGIRLYGGQIAGVNGINAANNITTIGGITIESSTGDGIRLESMGGISISNVINSDLGSPAHYRHNAADVTNATHYTVYADSLCQSIKYEGQVWRSQNSSYTFLLKGVACVGHELNGFTSVDREFLGNTTRLQDDPIRQAQSPAYVYNLLSNSENFTAWTILNTGIYPETTKKAPDVTSPLFRVYDSTSLGQHAIIAPLVSLPNGDPKDYNFSCYVRYGSGINRIDIKLGASDLSNSASVGFDILHGRVVKKLDIIGNAALKNAEIYPEKDSFYRLSITVTMPANSFDVRPFVYTSQTLNSIFTGDSYRGASNYFYICNAQVTQTSTTIPYVPFNNSVKKIFWDNVANQSQPFTPIDWINKSDSLVVRNGSTYEVADRNSLTYGAGMMNQTYFENRIPATDLSVWVKLGATTATSTQKLPDSSATVLKFVEAALDTSHAIYSPVAYNKGTDSADYTLSILAKASERRYVSVRFGDYGFSQGRYSANIDLNTGDILLAGATGGVTGKRVKVLRENDGWYRISLTATFPQSVTTLSGTVYMITNNLTSGFGAKYVGDGNSGIYLSQPQISRTPYPIPYVDISNRKKVNWNWLLTAPPYTGGAVDSLRRTGINWEILKNGSWTTVGTDSIGAGGGSTYTAGRGIGIAGGQIYVDTTQQLSWQIAQNFKNIFFLAANTYSVGSAGTSAANVYSSSFVGTNILPLSTAGITFFNNGGGTKLAQLFNNGHVMIQPAGGTLTDVASSALTVNSTTAGILPPRMTTTQRTAIASPAEGLMVYDTDLHKLYVWDGTIWQAAW